MEGMVWLFLTSWELWGAKGWASEIYPGKNVAKTGGKRPSKFPWWRFLTNQHEIKSWIMNYSRWFTESFSSSSFQPNSSQNPENSLFTPLKGKLLPLSSPLCWRKLAPSSDVLPFLESTKTHKKIPQSSASQAQKKSCSFPNLQTSPRLPNKTPPQTEQTVSLGDSWPYPKKKQKKYLGGLGGERSVYFLLNMGEIFICSIAFC